MASAKEYFSSEASPILVAGMREIAWKKGTTFQAVLEDAMRTYIKSRAREGVRPEVMAHFQASVERNWKLGKLLADS